MKTRKTAIVTIASALALALLGSPAVDAQLKKWVKDAVKDTARSEGRRQVDRGIRHAIRCAVGEYECYEKAKSEGKEVVFVDDEGEVVTDAQGNPVTDPADLPPQNRQAPAGPASPAAQSVHADYDFEPGDRVILLDDYSADIVGDFPRRMELVRGNWDVIDYGGTRMLRNTGPRHSAIKIPLPEHLPQRFTIELSVLLHEGNANLALSTSPPEEGAAHQYRLHLYGHNYFDIGSWGVGLASRDPSHPTASQNVTEALTSAPVPIRIMADGNHVKMYVGEQRVANVPNADLVHGDALWIENTYSASEPILIGPIRVAGGGRDLYDALANEGRVAIHDILFDTDQATIKPQSAEVLTGIGTMLAQHPELSLMIEGHTDSTGDFDHNMDLSQRRAESVRQWLVDRHGIAAERLRAMGLGSTQPKAPNDTDANRQQNRRVELVRVG